jgi:hypothetical protein
MSAAANELRVDADGDRVVHAEFFLSQVPPVACFEQPLSI